jgi:hypothetical protein
MRFFPMLCRVCSLVRERRSPSPDGLPSRFAHPSRQFLAPVGRSAAAAATFSSGLSILLPGARRKWQYSRRTCSRACPSDTPRASIWSCGFPRWEAHRKRHRAARFVRGFLEAQYSLSGSREHQTLRRQPFFLRRRSGTPRGLCSSRQSAVGQRRDRSGKWAIARLWLRRIRLEHRG